MSRSGEAALPLSAIASLVHCFAQPLDQARAAQEGGATVVGAVAHTVPWELVRAAGFSPVTVRPTRRPGSACAEYLEAGVFGPRIRSLFESTLAGDLSFLSALIFARTSEQDYKAYLYLREVTREARAAHAPPLWFYDLLHSSSSHAYDYGLARTRELVARLEALAGRRVHPDDLAAAIEESNAARAAARRLLALRGTSPRLTGTEALPLLGAFFLMDRARYATLAGRAVDAITSRASLEGPRLVIAGAWLDDERLHALLESHGAVVVAEEGGWGTRGAVDVIACGADPVVAIFEKYYRDGPSVRQLPGAGRAWLHELKSSAIDGVVFYLPPDDSVAGWDVPSDRQQLDARGVNSLVIRDEVNDPEMPRRWHERIATFVDDLGRDR